LGSIGGCVGAGWFLFGDGEDEKAAIINDRVCQSMGEIASLGCFNRATQLLYVERNWQEGLKMLGYACEKGFGSACIQRATLVQSQPEDALHAKASGELDATASWCSEGRDGEACLNVAEWFAYKGKRAKAFEYMTLAKKFLSAKCQEGHKPDCRIMKLRLREQ
jgi:TPR repeat protein